MVEVDETYGKWKGFEMKLKQGKGYWLERITISDVFNAVDFVISDSGIRLYDKNGSWNGRQGYNIVDSRIIDKGGDGDSHITEIDGHILYGDAEYTALQKAFKMRKKMFLQHN